MSSSNAWAEFSNVFRRTREAYLEHENAKAQSAGSTTASSIAQGTNLLGGGASTSTHFRSRSGSGSRPEAMANCPAQAKPSSRRLLRTSPRYPEKPEAVTETAIRTAPRKYPPAEPGALGLEPLKAACPRRPAPLSFSHSAEYLTSILEQSPVNSLARYVMHCFLASAIWFILKLLSSSIGGTPFRVLWRLAVLSLMDRGRRPPDMSNFCCLPGRAGGTPRLV
jgi:hypothetical protein